MKANMTGVILAGGKNSRMGTNKSLLLVNGISMVERIVAVLKPIVNEIIIITNGNNYNYLGFKTYKDLIKDCGPMGGIYTAMTYSNYERNFVVSCDMPFITTECVHYIIENSKNCDIAVPFHNKKLEPLCAVYDKSCQAKMDTLLRRGEWKLQNALEHFNTKKIVIPDTLIKDNCFANINTTSEYETLKLSIHANKY